MLLPGEIERRTREERLRHGIPLDDTTIGEIAEAAISAGITHAEREQKCG